MFGSKNSVKLDPDLLERCKQHAKTAGYSTLEEFLHHALESALQKAGSQQEDNEKQVLNRLKGLGYIE